MTTHDVLWPKVSQGQSQGLSLTSTRRQALAVAALGNGVYTGYTAGSAQLHACASLFMWLRQLRLLALSPSLGPLVYMGFKMVGDVAKWLVLVLAILLAFAAAFSVLLRDQAMGGGGSFAFPSPAGSSAPSPSPEPFAPLFSGEPAPLPTCANLLASTDCDTAIDHTKCAEALERLTSWSAATRNGRSARTLS